MLTDRVYLEDCFSKAGYTVSDKQFLLFSEYFDAVIDSNKAFNLTAITQERDFIVKHFTDSLAAIKHIPLNSVICDVGAGAGFPSVPLAIMRPDIKIVALDSTAKKTDFINRVAENLELENLTARTGRAEEQRSLFGTFDVVTARAVAPLSILLELAAPLLKTGGLFIAYKTESETESVSFALKELNVRLNSTEKFSLPNGDRRVLLIFEKEGKTPLKYPRAYGAIKKKPL